MAGGAAGAAPTCPKRQACRMQPRAIV
jgi:hypothetical protein